MAEDEAQDINSLYKKYVAAKDEGTRKELKGKIYEQAVRMAASRSGWGMHPEQEDFHSEKPEEERQIHEYLWLSDRNILYHLVEDGLRNFNPKKDASFSTYLMNGIGLKYISAVTYVNGLKHAGRQREYGIFEDFPIAAKDNAKSSTEDDGLVKRICAALETINREDIKFYLAYHIGDKTLKEVGAENNVSRQRAERRIERINSQLSTLLRPLYNDYTSDYERNELELSLQAALQQLAKEYKEKGGRASTIQHQWKSGKPCSPAGIYHRYPAQRTPKARLYAGKHC